MDKNLSQKTIVYFTVKTDRMRFLFQLFAILADHERKRLILRTKAGLASARARGRKGGRPPGLSAEKIRKAEHIKVLFDAGKDIEEIKKHYKLSKATIYRHINYIIERDTLS